MAVNRCSVGGHFAELKLKRKVGRWRHLEVNLNESQHRPRCLPGVRDIDRKSRQHSYRQAAHGVLWLDDSSIGVPAFEYTRTGHPNHFGRASQGRTRTAVERA